MVQLLMLLFMVIHRFQIEDRPLVQEKMLAELLKVFCSTKVHEVAEERNGYHVILRVSLINTLGC